MKISIANTKFSFKYSRRAKPSFQPFFFIFPYACPYFQKKKNVPDGLHIYECMNVKQTILNIQIREKKQIFRKYGAHTSLLVDTILCVFFLFFFSSS